MRADTTELRALDSTLGRNDKIDAPHCRHCGAAMRLAAMEAFGAAGSRVTFDCSCGEQTTLAFDPRG